MKNLIENDPLVAAIIEATVKLAGDPEDKLKALIRCGKIAEVYSSGYASNWDAAEATLSGTELAQTVPKIRIYPSPQLRQRKSELVNTGHSQAS